MCIMFQEMETVFFIVWVSHFTVIWPCLVLTDRQFAITYWKLWTISTSHRNSKVFIPVILSTYDSREWLCYFFGNWLCSFITSKTNQRLAWVQNTSGASHILTTFQSSFKSDNFQINCYSKINIFNTWHLLWMIHKQANQKLIHPTIMRKHRKL